MKKNILIAKVLNKEPLLLSAVVCFLCSAIVTNMLFHAVSSSIFYWCCYISIVYFFINLKKITLPKTHFSWFVIVLFFYGLLRCVWAAYIRHYAPDQSPQGSDTIGQYFLAGKRMMIGSILIYWIHHNQAMLKKQTIYLAKAICLVGIIGIIYASTKEYFFVTHERIKLTADAASSSSYMLLALMAAYLWLSLTLKKNFFFIADIVAIIAFGYLMSLTGTRIAMIAYLVLSVSYLGYNLQRNNIKRIATCSLLFLVLAGAFATVNSHRFDEIKSDIDSYHNNSSTSIGARFTIWKAGLSTLTHPFAFQVPDSRTEQARLYITEHDPKNTEAYNNVKYNMHNEFLEAISLQGVAGLIALLLIYILAITGYLRHQPMAGIMLPLLALLICGLTDSVFIYPPTVMLYIMALALCSINPKGVENVQ